MPRRLIPIAIAGLLAVSPALAAEEGGLAPGLIAVEPITVPIIDGGRLRGTLRFTVVLDAGSAEAAGPVAAIMPQNRAALLAAAMEFARLCVSAEAPVDVARLASDLRTAVRAASPGVRNVLIVEVRAVSGR